MKNSQIQEALTKESIFIIGYVSSVEGRTVKVKVNKNKNASHLLYNGAVLKNVSVGSFIKIIKGYTEIIGKVEGESITSEKVRTTKYNEKKNQTYEKEENKIVRYLNVSLFGHFDGKKFEQGIKEMPLIDNECYLLDKSEFNRLHQFYGKGEKTIKVGHLTEEPSQKIEISINKLFASHIGIFGNTGSGKSNTLARVYYELFEKMNDNENFKKKSKFVVIDFNGEYGKKTKGAEKDEIITSTENKEVYFLSTGKKQGDRIPLHEKDLIDIELISILANATDKTQKPFIRRAIGFYNKVQKEESEGAVGDLGLDYFKNTLKNRLKLIFQMSIKDKAQTLLDYVKQILEISDSDEVTMPEWNNKNEHFMPIPVPSPTRAISEDEIKELDFYKKIDDYTFPSNAITKLIHFLYLQLIFDVYNDKAQNDHIAPAVNKLKSKQKDIEKILDTESDDQIFPDGKNLIVINLKNANLEIKKTLPLIISKKLYDEHKDSENFRDQSLNIIIDEAHNILSSSSERESETWKDYRLETFEEIIKEGRKFNVFLTIASQRPYDISSTIISQLHNYFIHRLINDFDINAIHKTVAYLDKLSFESIPVLTVGSCFFAGLASNIPVKVSVDYLKKENRPNSETVELERLWE